MMIRRLSALGLVVAAVLGLAAVWAASASAAGEKFHTEIEPTVLTGSNTLGEETFTVGGFSIKCPVAVSGTWTIKTPETMTLHPTYGGIGACKDSLGKNASIFTTGCNYIYWSELIGADAKVEIECEAGQVIKVATEGCTMTIGAQANLGATYANGTVGGVPEITVKNTWEAGFPVKHGACLEIAGNKGKFTGSTTVKGYVDECAAGECPFAPGGIGDKDGYKEGNVIGISWK